MWWGHLKDAADIAHPHSLWKKKRAPKVFFAFSSKRKNDKNASIFVSSSGVTVVVVVVL